MTSDIRKYKKLPVVIIDDHNDALAVIHRAIASRHLPFNGVTMVHLDAHPDLGVPEKLTAESIYDKDTLYESLDIENWITPAVFAGHLDRLAWIKPEWSHQLREGSSQVIVGQCRHTATLRIDCPEDYFLFDGTYASAEDLLKQKPLNLAVYTLHTNDEHKNSVTADALKTFMKCDPYVLDIDLDFFSTQNPFLDEYSHEQMTLLKELFKFSPPKVRSRENMVKSTQLRRQHLAELRTLFMSFQANEKVKDGHDVRLLTKIVEDIEGEGRSVDYEMLYNAGVACDDVGLPHHVTDMDDIQRGVAMTEALLLALHKPTLVTMARSSGDEYCPRHQVDAIEGMVVKMLESVYRDICVDRRYDSCT